MDIGKQSVLEKLKNAGEISKATSYLKEEIYSKEVSLSSTESLTELCMLYIKQSRYKEAYDQGLLIQRIANIKNFPLWRILIAAHLIGFSNLFEQVYFIRFCRAIAYRFISFNGILKPEYRTFEGVLWGVYWQDMRQALKMNVLCSLAAKSEDERIKGLAFLYYTLTFFGFAWLGLMGLRKLLIICQKNNRPDLEGELLTWVGVAYQMSRRPKECLETHRRLAEKFPNAEPFFQIISYASQLNMSAAELGPVEVADTLGKCFSISFGLKESRNHIQIYGAKAALLALEGREEEAISFLERARLSKERNSNTLDTAIFHRFAAVTYLNLNKPMMALDHIEEVSRAIQAYAPLMWYRQEIARLNAIAKYKVKPTVLNKIAQIGLFVSKSLFSPDPHFFWKAIEIAGNFLSQRGMSYWRQADISEYFKLEILKGSRGNKSLVLEKMTTLLTKTILDSKNIYSSRKPDLETLQSQLSAIFPGATVLLASDLSDCLNIVKKQHGLSSSFLLNEEGDSLRVSCLNGKYLIAIQMEKMEEFQDSIAVGVVTNDLDVISHEAIELALRIISTLHVSMKLSFQLRDEKAQHEQKLMIASVAKQVAHDIRSPLGALELALRSVESLPPDNRLLFQNAVRRIKNIADDLLLRSKTLKVDFQSNIKGPHEDKYFSVSEAIDEILKESNSYAKQIQISSSVSKGLLAIGDNQRFQRLLSNLINNSIEALVGRENPFINISASKRRELVIVSIQDNGKGIPDEIIPKIGESGFSYNKGNGNGLGVSSAISTLKSWGGEFQINSKEGAGTLVSLKLVGVP